MNGIHDLGGMHGFDTCARDAAPRGWRAVESLRLGASIALAIGLIGGVAHAAGGPDATTAQVTFTGPARCESRDCAFRAVSLPATNVPYSRAEDFFVSVPTATAVAEFSPTGACQFYEWNGSSCIGRGGSCNEGTPASEPNAMSSCGSACFCIHPGYALLVQMSQPSLPFSVYGSSGPITINLAQADPATYLVSQPPDSPLTSTKMLFESIPNAKSVGRINCDATYDIWNGPLSVDVPIAPGEPFLLTVSIPGFFTIPSASPPSSPCGVDAPALAPWGLALFAAIFALATALLFGRRMKGMRRAVTLVLALLLLTAGRTFAERAVQGAVGEVSEADGAALGQVGFRIWSLTGGLNCTPDYHINCNTAPCRDIRCVKSYRVDALLASPGSPGGGGYVGNQEKSTGNGFGGSPISVYQLVDASMNDGAGNHIGFYGVAGVTADDGNSGTHVGAGCTPRAAQSCLQRLDSSLALPPLTGAAWGYGGPPGTIRAIGGLNPIPNVRVSVGGPCSPGLACLSWNDSPTYANAMQPTYPPPDPPNPPLPPVLGVTLYKNVSASCTHPSGDDPGWTFVGRFDLGTTTTTDPRPTQPGSCAFYALKVRLTGPGYTGTNDYAHEIETYRVGVNSQPVSASTKLH